MMTEWERHLEDLEEAYEEVDQLKAELYSVEGDFGENSDEFESAFGYLVDAENHLNYLLTFTEEDFS